MMSGISTKDQLFHFVDDLESSLDYNPQTIFDCDNIILCGVGGSAVSGDFAADCCFTESVKPIRLSKYPDLPRWVGSRTLAIVSSYSGNTAETMEMYRQAKARGSTVVAVTSGGLLKAAAEESGDMLVLLPEGMHPRHAIGFMIGYTLAVIHSAGGPDLSSRIRAFIPSLRKFRDDQALPRSGMAWRLAENLSGKVPVICSDSSMRSVAFRWKTQINENSKRVAFCDYAPAFNAGGLKTWATTSRDNYMLILLIGSDDEMCSSTSYLEEASATLAESESPSQVIRLGGESTLENMFRAIILGDYMSIYMAEMRGIDAAEVRPVMQMKGKLSTLGH